MSDGCWCLSYNKRTEEEKWTLFCRSSTKCRRREKLKEESFDFLWNCWQWWSWSRFQLSPIWIVNFWRIAILAARSESSHWGEGGRAGGLICSFGGENGFSVLYDVLVSLWLLSSFASSVIKNHRCHCDRQNGVSRASGGQRQISNDALPKYNMNLILLCVCVEEQQWWPACCQTFQKPSKILCTCNSQIESLIATLINCILLQLKYSWQVTHSFKSAASILEWPAAPRRLLSISCWQGESYIS